LREKSVPRRFAAFFVVGIIVEAVRLTAFALLLEGMSPWKVNLVSMGFSLIVAFPLYALLVWPDRPGRIWCKIVRFVISRGATITLKGGLFPFWVSWVPCPLYKIVLEVVGAVVKILPLVRSASTIISCEFMSAALMDLMVAVFIVFTLHDRVSFWRRG